MRDFALAVVALLDRPDVQYADIRVIRRHQEMYRTKNGLLEAWEDEEDEGFGIRVLIGGFWGFAAHHALSETAVTQVAGQAVRLARAAATAGGNRVCLAEQETHVGEWIGPCHEDPVSLAAEDKISFLLAAASGLLVPGVSYAVGNLGSIREEKVFASTEGSVIAQVRTETGAGLSAIAVRDGEVQVRSYPSAGSGSWALGGFEVVRAFDLADHAPRVGEEAVALLDAPSCPAGETTVILDPDQMALQIHESVGHPTELDRILGSEASYAGTSFLSPADLGRLRYGSEHVTIVADATIPGGLGTFPFDDEGVPAMRVSLLREGLLDGFLMSRESASVLGLTSNGTMRASGWNRIPLIRMTNINLAPGSWTLDKLIEDTREGVLMATNRSWSIDDRRLNFHFTTEIGWEIRNGRLGRMLKDCSYMGTTPRFWQSCDAVCNEDHWQLLGIVNCGKGEPGQAIGVGHGTAPARFRNVRVGRSS